MEDVAEIIIAVVGIVSIQRSAPMTVAKCGCWVDLGHDMHWCDVHKALIQVQQNDVND